jgi:hypothetical protein
MAFGERSPGYDPQLGVLGQRRPEAAIAVVEDGLTVVVWFVG